MTRIATIVGARPQFVKAAAVSRAIAAAPGLDECLIHTGQHYDDAMSGVFFRELGLAEPDHNLGIAAATHGAMTGRMLEGIERILIAEEPDLVLVYGDTNSTLAGALAAAKLHLPVAHVEAGLRSFNRQMPEELNRVVTDHLAKLLFCPTAAAIENLRREGISDGVHHTGDVMYDATLFAIEAARASDVLTRLGLEAGDYSLCTLHRAENTDDPGQLARLCDYLGAVAAAGRLVVPLHPRTRAALARHGLGLGAALVIEPAGYLDLHALLQGSAMVYTDSGGLQKEAYFHGKRCVTLRGETEWVETIEHGWNRLWEGADFTEPRRPIPDYGDGHAAQAIVALIAGHKR